MSGKIMQPSFTLNVSQIRTAVVSYANSKRFMKGILPISVINIVYNRVDVDHTQFEERNTNDIHFMMYKSKSKYPLIRDYFAWMKGALDAFDKNYLREMYLLILDKQSKEINEFYTFTFTYNSVSKEKKNPNELHKTTCELLDMIKNLSSYDKWNEENVTLTVELTFYPKETPLSYVPPYFDEPTEETYTLKVAEYISTNEVLRGNKLDTGFHRMRCWFGGKMFIAEKEMSNSQTEKYATPGTSGLSQTSLKRSYDVIILSDEETEKMEKRSKKDPKYNLSLKHPSKIDKFNISGITIASSLEDQTNTGTTNMEQTVDCSCKLNYQHPKLELVICSVCEKYFHTSCQGFLRRDDIPGVFVCTVCGKGSQFESSDSVEASVIDPEKLVLSRFRLILAYCYLTENLPNEVLNKLPRDIQSSLWAKLEKLNVFPKDQKTNKYKVDRKRIEQIEVFKGINEFDSMKLPDGESPKKKARI